MNTPIYNITLARISTIKSIIIIGFKTRHLRDKSLEPLFGELMTILIRDYKDLIDTSVEGLKSFCEAYSNAEHFDRVAILETWLELAFSDIVKAEKAKMN